MGFLGLMAMSVIGPQRNTLHEKNQWGFLKKNCIFWGLDQRDSRFQVFNCKRIIEERDMVFTCMCFLTRCLKMDWCFSQFAPCQKQICRTLFTLCCSITSAAAKILWLIAGMTLENYIYCPALSNAATDPVQNRQRSDKMLNLPFKSCVGIQRLLYSFASQAAAWGASTVAIYLGGITNILWLSFDFDL